MRNQFILLCISGIFILFVHSKIKISRYIQPNSCNIAMCLVYLTRLLTESRHGVAKLNKVKEKIR